MILVPATSLEDWKARLSSADSEWQPGSSAHELAARWSQRTTFPPEISALFDGVERTKSATLLLALPEHQVPLAGGARASQTDLWILARTTRGLLSVVVEGTVNGSFGPAIGDWQPETAAGRERWAALCALLEIEQPCDASIRAQLLHRTATALLEARRFFSRGAAVIVHSFSRTAHGFGDFQHFVRMMGGIVRAPGELIAVPSREGIELFFGWAQGPVGTP
jgi:hypothetical protein